jgi:hypothetical protein
VPLFFSAVPGHGHVLGSCVTDSLFVFAHLRHHRLVLDFLVLDSGVVRLALPAPGCVVIDTQSLHRLEAWSSAALSYVLTIGHICSRSWSRSTSEQVALAEDTKCGPMVCKAVLAKSLPKAVLIPFHICCGQSPCPRVFPSPITIVPCPYPWLLSPAASTSQNPYTRTHNVCVPFLCWMFSHLMFEILVDCFLPVPVAVVANNLNIPTPAHNDA